MASSPGMMIRSGSSATICSGLYMGQANSDSPLTFTPPAMRMISSGKEPGPTV